MKLVLLPGMDGTGELFQPFTDKTPRGWSTQVVEYPRTVPLDYAACTDLARRLLPDTEDYLLLGESFSGPVALQLASDPPRRLRGLILCNTFAVPPHWSGFRFLPWRAVFSLPMPRFVARHRLGAGSVGHELEDLLRSVVATVAPDVLACRMRCILTVDAGAALAAVRVPILCLRGTRDAVVKEDSASYIRAQRPDVHLAELSAPHLLLQAAPVEAWNAIARFSVLAR